jgi:hypothetical protein
MPDSLNELHGVEIEDILGLGIIAETLVITGQTENIVNSKRCSPENITLQGYPVTISYHHLEHRVDPLLLQVYTGRQAAQPGNRGLIVGDIDRIHMIPDQISFFDDVGRIT